MGHGSLLAIAAVLGISTRSARPPVASAPSPPDTKKDVPVKRGGNPLSSSVCAVTEKLLQQFVLANEDDVAAPDSCYPGSILQDPMFRNRVQGPQERLQQRTSHLNFIIAILPDPLHTHLSLLCDRKIEFSAGGAGCRLRLRFFLAALGDRRTHVYAPH